MQALKDIVCANVEDDAAKQGIYETYVGALYSINPGDVAKHATEREIANVNLYKLIKGVDDASSETQQERIWTCVDKLVERERLLQNIGDTMARCNGDDHKTFAARTKLQGTLFEGLDHRLINHPSFFGQSCIPKWKWAGRKLWAFSCEGEVIYGKVGKDTEKVQRDNVIGVIAGYDKECANYICDEIERLAAQHTRNLRWAKAKETRLLCV